MKAVAALAVIVALLWLSSAKRYPCSEIGCPHLCFEDGDLCPGCRAWLEASEPLTREYITSLV
jgi:hypothetical protein